MGILVGLIVHLIMNFLMVLSRIWTAHEDIKDLRPSAELEAMRPGHPPQLRRPGNVDPMPVPADPMQVELLMPQNTSGRTKSGRTTKVIPEVRFGTCRDPS